MKRIAVLFLILFFSTGLFAQNKPKYAIKNDSNEDNKIKNIACTLYGLAYAAAGMQGDLKYDASHIRLRPGLVMGNDHITGVFRAEVDQNFGRGTTYRDADPGTDNIAVEVKHAYLEADNAIIDGLYFMGGLNAYSFPLVTDNDFGLLQARYDFGVGKIVFSLIAIDEYGEIEETASGVEQDTDLRAYAFDLPLQFDGFYLRPGFMYIAGGGGSYTAPDARLMSIALSAGAELGIMTINAAGAYLKGDLSTDVKTSAYGFDISVETKPVSWFKIGLFFTLGSGNDGTDAEQDNSYFYNMNMLFGDTADRSGAPDGRLLLLENRTVANSLTNAPASGYDYMDDPLGYMSYGIYAGAEFDKLKLYAGFGMAGLMEENTDGNRSIGSEADFKVSYTVFPKTDLFIEGGCIISGDIIEDNVYQGAMGITTDL